MQFGDPNGEATCGHIAQVCRVVHTYTLGHEWKSQAASTTGARSPIVTSAQLCQIWLDSSWSMRQLRTPARGQAGRHLDLVDDLQVVRAPHARARLAGALLVHTVVLADLAGLGLGLGLGT